MLHFVRLDDLIYPCWAYALARTGRKFTVEWLQHEMPRLQEDYDPQGACIGDILIWHNSEDEICRDNFPVCMQHDGIIVNEPVVYDSHVAVLEGYGLISDMVAAYGKTIPFIVRTRRLVDLKAAPVKMIHWR